LKEGQLMIIKNPLIMKKKIIDPILKSNQDYAIKSDLDLTYEIGAKTNISRLEGIFVYPKN